MKNKTFLLLTALANGVVIPTLIYEVLQHPEMRPLFAVWWNPGTWQIIDIIMGM